MFSAITTHMADLVSRFAVVPDDCSETFFGLIPWYQYLPDDHFGPSDISPNADRCDITQFNFLGAESDIVLVLLAITDDLLRVAGMVAVFFVIYGGFQYITSRGEPDKSATARKTLINALIGLVISLVAIAIVSFIGRSIG